jgi:hypothetical protein
MGQKCRITHWKGLLFCCGQDVMIGQQRTYIPLLQRVQEVSSLGLLR